LGFTSAHIQFSIAHWHYWHGYDGTERGTVLMVAPIGTESGTE
jgi:hypothetical protein